jgi:hypothetical protein
MLMSPRVTCTHVHHATCHLYSYLLQTLLTAPLVAMSSLKDDNLGRVHARWDGTNEVNPRGCHMAFDQ